MTSERQHLSVSIRESFPVGEAVCLDQLLRSAPEKYVSRSLDEETLEAADYFLGRTWDMVTGRNLSVGGPTLWKEALPLLSEAAQWYFLPAYLTMYLKGETCGWVILSSSMLRPSVDRSGLFAGFIKSAPVEQKRCLVRFIDLVRAQEEFIYFCDQDVVFWRALGWEVFNDYS